MKKKNLLSIASFALAALLLCSCNVSNSKKDTITELYIGTNAFHKEANSSAIFSSARCIPLETGDDVLISEITKVINKNDALYVSDLIALYKFNTDGTFIAKIEKRGYGPGEYIYISDFEIDSDGTAWILCRNEKKLYKYTWSGKLEKEITLDYPAARMSLVADDRMCFYIGNELDGDNQHQLKIVDLKDNHVIANCLDIDVERAKYLHVHSKNHFSKNSDSSLYFFNIFDNAIYTLSKNEIREVFQVDISGKNIPPSVFNNGYDNVVEFFQTVFAGDYAYGTVLFVERKESWLYSYYYNRECHLAVISKEAGKAEIDFTILIEDRLLSGYPIPLSDQDVFVLNDNSIALPLIPADIARYAAEHLSSNGKDGLLQTINYSGEDQNPVILILD